MQRVGFTRMDQGTAADYALALAAEQQEKHQLPDRILGLLRSLSAATAEVGGRYYPYTNAQDLLRELP